MFDQFPKSRPALPLEYQALYATHYKANREGASPASSLAQKLERWLHVQVAADLRMTRNDDSTLEIGAGTLNQLDYEPGVRVYDIVEPFEYLYRDAPQRERLRNIHADIADIDPANRYARITSVATFEHIANLPEVVARCGTLLQREGELRVSIPSEGTLLWTLGWMLSTGLEFRLKHGLDYGILMAHEHLNTAAEIRTILSHFFIDIDCRVFGLTPALSLYQFYGCRHPDLERCTDYLKECERNSQPSIG